MAVATTAATAATIETTSDVVATTTASRNGAHSCASLGQLTGPRSTNGFDLRFARHREGLAQLVIPSPSAHLPGSWRSATGQGGAPYRTNDLDPWRLVCLALRSEERR